MCKHTAVNEVDAELKKHPGVGALVNETTGEFFTFAAPVPYFGLTPAERTALETERNELLASVPGLKKRERAKAEDRIRRIESDLRRARAADESGRRTVERREERPQERYGQPGNTQQVVNTLTWASLRAELDSKTQAAQRALATSTVCCSGRYLCPKCKAKAGV